MHWSCLRFRKRDSIYVRIMYGQLISKQVVLFFTLALSTVFLAVPLTTSAQGNLDAVANLQCAQEVARRAASKPPIPPPPNPPFPCAGPHTTGQCMGPICKSEKFNAQAGQQGGASGLDQVMKALGDLFGKLMSQPKPPESPPSTPPPTFPGDNKGCQGARFSTNDVSLISNPCADYTPPPVSTEIPTDTGSCSQLSETLGLCTNTPNSCPEVPAVDCGAGNHPVSGGKDANGCVKRDTCEPDTVQTTISTPPATPPATTLAKPLVFSTTTGTFVMPPGGLRGDINARPTGATVFGGSRDTQGNVEVAGFYGASTFGGQGSQGLVGAWCRSRPWASNFLSKIITPTFFDNICKARGYQVGAPPPAPAVVLQQVKKPKTTTATSTVATSTTPEVPPKVDIWAVPASVPLGGRTSIFWNTQGVANCTETSPNGGFNQNSLSGGAATQPITAATTFSISCLAPDGSHVTGSVTVNLKI